jgi:predicted permease
LRHAVRLYARTLRGSLVAILALALGMAFAGAFLSLYVDLVLRPDPGFQDSRRITTIGQQIGEYLLGMPYEVVERMSDEMTSIEAAATVGAITTIVESASEPITTGLVSSEFFTGLRPHLVFGRGFSAEDHDREAAPVVVLSYRYWQQQFDADASVIGTVLDISRNPGMHYEGDEPEQDSAQFRIVGVMAQTLPRVGQIEPRIWLPLERVWPLFLGTAASLQQGMGSATYVRRAPGVSTAVVANELLALYDSPDAFANQFPVTQLDAIDGIVGNISVQRETRRQLEMFLAGSLLLAIVAGANVSLFLLARAPGRRRELGIRMAVGAPLTRLACQLAMEAGLLVVLGGLLGLLGSIWLSTIVPSLDMLRDAEWDRVTLFDWRVLGLFGLLLLVIGTLVSLAPIMGLKRLGIAESSRQVSARASLAQRLAGTVQLGVAAVIGAAAIVFGWHLSLMMFGNAGYEMADRYLVEGSSDFTPVNYADYSLSLANRREAILAIPGVTAVAFGYPVPARQSGGGFPARISNPTESEKPVEAYYGVVSRPFVELLGLRLLRGRAPEEDETADVVVVNQALARSLWGHDDVVGERLPPNNNFGDQGGDVIGVLEDLSFEHPSATVPPFVFTTLVNGSPRDLLTIIEAELMASELHQALDQLVSTGVLEMTVQGIRPLSSLRNDTLSNDRVRTFLIMGAAAIVVFLVAIGFYGTQHYLVAAGRREYAIRGALGAGPRAIGQSVLRGGILMSLPGLVAGGMLAFIAVTWSLDEYVSRQISPVGVTLWVVIGLVVLVLAASLGPARRAMRTQPAPLLRED